MKPDTALEAARAHHAFRKALGEQAADVVDEALARLLTSCRGCGLVEAAFVVAAAKEAGADPVAFAIAVWTWADRVERHTAQAGGSRT